MCSPLRWKAPLVGGIVLVLALVGTGSARSGPRASSRSRGRARAEVAVEPPAVVPTGAALEKLIRASNSLIVGVRNEPRAAALMRAAGARQLLTRVSLWLVPSAGAKPLL